VDSSLRRTTAGAGLGLFLSRAIVEAHDGRIWATSEPGRGTTVFFTLPVDEERLEA
jgi:signal transduction histidine kinase